MPDIPSVPEPLNRHVHLEETTRPDTPELEGGTPPPEEVTGRASGTGEDLTALFDNESTDHLADGFRGGSDNDQDVEIPKKQVPDVEAEA